MNKDETTIPQDQEGPDKLTGARWLPCALAVDIGLVSAFLLIRLSGVISFRIALLRSALFATQVLFALAWTAGGVLLWRRSPSFRDFFSWLIGGNQEVTAGTVDRTSMFATLAGFALAQSAALTAVAKGEGRDWIVILIYGAVVLFSYFWTRQVLFSRDVRERTEQFDTTTLHHARYTLAWILFLGSLMVTLGCYDLLPNQKWRQRFSGKELSCETKYARDYATALDDSQNKLQWIKWAADSPSGSALWIETASAFDASCVTFDVTVHHNHDRFAIQDLVAFLRHQKNPSSMPTYRQLPVHQPHDRTGAGELTASNVEQYEWGITIIDPDAGDKIVILCMASEKKTNPLVDVPIPPKSTFWLSKNQ